MREDITTKGGTKDAYKRRRNQVIVPRDYGTDGFHKSTELECVSNS
jgi:hypothetical protein